MQPREPSQLIVAERLHAEAEAVDARVAKSGETLDRDRFRIRLESDLDIVADVEGIPAGVDDARDLAGLQKRRRPAAEVNRVGCFPLALSRDLTHERVDVARFQRRVKETTIEVAVIANGRAERDVEVET